jgi:LmbE family N-acetylglucosaminyl deacetylase
MDVLAIGAHYDDVELGCGGSLLKLRRKGHKIHLLVVTDSEYTDGLGNVVRSREQAAFEGTRAAKRLGVSSIINMEYKCKKVKCDSTLIENINNMMDRISPDLIFTHWHGDLHEDHFEIARASLVAARHLPCVLMYRSNWYHAAENFNGRFYIDITSVINIKYELLKMHETEYSRRGEIWVDFAKAKAQEAGLRIGVPYAEEFEVFKYRMVIYENRTI